MFTAIPLALGDLARPRVATVLMLSIAITLALFAAAGWALARAIEGWNPCAMWEGVSCTIGTGEGTLAGAGLALLGLWFLFPAIAIGVVGLFADMIVADVEARHYPAAAARARPVGWGTSARLGLQSAVRLVGYNLIAAPFYLLMLATAIGPLILFVIVNALALGRDLTEMVAVRHVARADWREWRATSRSTRAFVGLVATGLFMVPVVNLVAPVFAAALATHVHHRRRA